MSVVYRAAHAAWIIILIALLLFANGSWDWIFRHAGYDNGGSTTATDVVTEDGFRLALSGITVSGGPGVAPAGTEIRVETIASPGAERVSEFIKPVGTGVEITLGDDLQPATPVRVTFAPTQVANWFAATSGDPDLVPIVLASNHGAFGVELADARVAADGSVVVVTDHLSQVYPGVASARGYSNWLVDQTAVIIGARSNAPDCYGGYLSNEEWTYSPVTDQVFWPCLDGSATRLDVNLTSNSAAVWLVSSDQATPAYPSTLSVPGLLTVSLGLQIVDRPTTSPLVPPDGEVTFSTTDPDDEIVFDVRLNRKLTVIHAVVSATTTLLPASKVKTIIDAYGQAECLIELIEDAGTGNGQADSGTVRTILSCLSSVIQGMTGTLISSVTTVPGASIAIAEATYRALEGTDRFTFTVSRRHIESSPSATTSWPTHRDDAPGRLYTWLGANMYGFPDWTACDDALTYCLVGYDGERHLLVQMNGLEPLYWIDDTVPNPREALLSTGLSPEVVDQILGIDP